eukprot:1433744-Amphidinium_carterae.1
MLRGEGARVAVCFEPRCSRDSPSRNHRHPPPRIAALLRPVIGHYPASYVGAAFLLVCSFLFRLGGAAEGLSFGSLAVEAAPP